MSDNVVNFKTDSTRAMLEKVLKAYDEGKIKSVVMIGQGVTEEGQRVLMPMVSEETTAHELSFASVLLSSYAGNVCTYLMHNGIRKDA